MRICGILGLTTCLVLAGVGCMWDGAATFDDGLAIGAAVGVDTRLGIRLEMELIHRNNAAASIDWGFPVGVITTSGDVTSRALMANVFYDFEIGPVEPYLEYGLGMMNVSFNDLSDANGPLFSGDYTTPVQQFIIGVAYPLSPKATLYLDHRGFDADERGLNFAYASTQRAAIAGQPIRNIDYSGRTAMLGLRYRF